MRIAIHVLFAIRRVDRADHTIDPKSIQVVLAVTALFKLFPQRHQIVSVCLFSKQMSLCLSS
jgi:hypothetical protein